MPRRIISRARFAWLLVCVACTSIDDTTGATMSAPDATGSTSTTSSTSPSAGNQTEPGLSPTMNSLGDAGIGSAMVPAAMPSIGGIGGWSSPPTPVDSAGMHAGVNGAAGTAGVPRQCANEQLLCDGTCVPSDSRNCGKCGHDCTTLPNIVGNVDCVSGHCEFGPAACAKGWLHCVPDPQLGCETDVTQATNCGACGVQCGAGTPMCSNGTCVSGCPASTPTLCGNTCVELQSDALHCGSCEKACTTNVARAQPSCARGSCSFTCTNGLSACGNACVDTSSDSKHCGMCNQACSGGKLCMSGRCTCPAGTHDCGGSCARDDSVTACGTSCQACRSGVARSTDTCEGGRCSYRCNLGYSECTGACVDQLSDDRNCGSCGRACTGGKRCALGVCVCSTGQHDCSGTCVSNTSTNSCGSSCTPCPSAAGATSTCDGRTCGSTCNSGVTCFGACVNTANDPSNCGGCGIQCEGLSTCDNGLCL